MPVIGVDAEQTAAANFIPVIERAHANGSWGIFLFHSIRPTANDWYAGVEIADITASIEHARGLGDMWIGTMVDIAAYLRAQEMFEELSADGDVWTWTLPEHFPPGKVLRVTSEGGTLSQNGAELDWDRHGYYEVALDAGTLKWAP